MSIEAAGIPWRVVRGLEIGRRGGTRNRVEERATQVRTKETLGDLQAALESKFLAWKAIQDQATGEARIAAEDFSTDLNQASKLEGYEIKLTLSTTDERLKALPEVVRNLIEVREQPNGIKVAEVSFGGGNEVRPDVFPYGTGKKDEENGPPVLGIIYKGEDGMQKIEAFQPGEVLDISLGGKREAERFELKNEGLPLRALGQIKLNDAMEETEKGSTSPGPVGRVWVGNPMSMKLK
jgi:hypothetical protein